MTLSQLSQSESAHRAALKRRGVASPPPSRIAVDDDVECQVERGSPKSAPAGDGGGRLKLRQQSKKRSPSSVGIGGGTNRTDAADESASTTAAGSVPIRVLLRKIAMAILTDLDDETLQREDTETILIIITLLKEAMWGILIAFAFVLVFLCLDHIFALRLPTARNFRKASFAMMKDPDTLKSFEENSGLKFVEMDSYDSMLQEIARADNKTKLAQSIFEKRGKELVEYSAQRDEMESKVKSIKASMGLERFNPEGVYHGAVADHSCQWRVNYLMTKNNVPKIKAIIHVMKRTSCQKDQKQIDDDARIQHMLDEVQKIVNHWDRYGKEFNALGEWGVGTICADRADYLSGRFSYPLNKAKAMTMVETNQCRNSLLEDEIESFQTFCEECLWDKKGGFTCGQRVEYLKSRYEYTEQQAKHKVMGTPACARNHGGMF